MAGHVNMMDDFIISNLSRELLRSSLRALVSLGSVNQKHFVQNVRDAYVLRDTELTAPSRLFFEHEQVSEDCQSYMEDTRCVLGCKLTMETLKRLTHFVDAIQAAQATWSEPSPLSDALQSFDGDVVQAMQALKESRAPMTPELKDNIFDLHISLSRCRMYCESRDIRYLFTRGARQVQDTFNFLFQESITNTSTSSNKGIDIDTSRLTSIETFPLGIRSLPRLFTGFWQLSSSAWSSGSAEAQGKALVHLVENGFTAADMADHYGDAELIYGDFRARLSQEMKSKIFAATKWCVFHPVGQEVTREWVLEAVRERSRRLRGTVDLLQFHWYDYNDKSYLGILVYLIAISKEQPDLVTYIGLCNFDSEHVEEACEFLLQKTGSVGLVSNQVQFSLLDSRPLQKMTTVCAKYDLKLLTYGTFCGGLLSEKWLGKPSPEIYSTSDPITPSQRKYLDVIQTWGPWPTYQSLLGTLSQIAATHNVSLTNVATRWVLQQPTVGAVLVGTRLGVSSRAEENLKTYEFRLSDGEMETLNDVALGNGKERLGKMFERMGDCGDEYRAMH